MFVIGLGNGGVRIAEEFSAYPQYEVYKIGVGLEDSTRSRNLPIFNSPEQYEEQCPDFTDFFKDLEEEILFIMVGSSEITGASLRILESLKHCKINVLYVRPDISLLSKKRSLQERITFNVFQEYARSGLFNKLYIVDNLVVEQFMGEVPITQYHKKINSIICSTIHMINIYKNNEPILLTDSGQSDISKICTLGICDPVSGKESLFYNLSHITEKFYYYSISKSVLEKDGRLLSKIKNQVKEKLSDNIKGGFGVYENEWKENFVYVEANTHILQNIIDNA